MLIFRRNYGIIFVLFVWTKLQGLAGIVWGILLW